MRLFRQFSNSVAFSMAIRMTLSFGMLVSIENFAEKWVERSQFVITPWTPQRVCQTW